MKTIQKASELVVGSLVRMNTDAEYKHPFAECLVVKVDETQQEVLLARPYGYVSNANTSCPTVLLGYENFSARFETIEKYFHLLESSKGIPHNFAR